MGSRETPFEVAIIGGGIGGLCLGIALEHRGVPVQIYESAHHFGEIGAGVSFLPNAIQAMKICHPGILEAFQKVVSRNLWPSKQKVWFDYYDGVSEGSPHAFTITDSSGQNGVYRADFLDALIHLFPEEKAHFGKRLDGVKQNADGKCIMHFADGSEASSDAVIGADGIKSAVRRAMFGENHPCAWPVYSHKYAYRALAPMKDAVAAIGEEKANNACMFMGRDKHVLTFPVRGGQIMNVVAFITDPKEWADHSKLTKPAKREEALRDFADMNGDIKKILELTKPDLDIWAIFDLGQNPPPAFSKGRLCILGDAAHATSPHHGAGAGMAIEDSAVLAELLADAFKTENKDLDSVFSVFDAERRERGAWLVQSSRKQGDVYERRGDGIGEDFTKIEEYINKENKVILDVDVSEMCQAAKDKVAAQRSSD